MHRSGLARLAKKGHKQGVQLGAIPKRDRGGAVRVIPREIEPLQQDGRKSLFEDTADELILLWIERGKTAWENAYQFMNKKYLTELENEEGSVVHQSKAVT